MKKLPVHESKNILKFDTIPWAGNKNEIVLRVLALRTGHSSTLQKGKASSDRADYIAKHLINAQYKLNIISNKFEVCRWAFSTRGTKSVRRQASRGSWEAGYPTRESVGSLNSQHGKPGRNVRWSPGRNQTGKYKRAAWLIQSWSHKNVRSKGGGQMDGGQRKEGGHLDGMVRPWLAT